MENRLIFQITNPIFKDYLYIQIKHNDQYYFKDIKTTLIGDDMYFYIDNKENLFNIKIALCLLINPASQKHIKITHYKKACQNSIIN